MMLQNSSPWGTSNSKQASEVLMSSSKQASDSRSGSKQAVAGSNNMGSWQNSMLQSNNMFKSQSNSGSAFNPHHEPDPCYEEIISLASSRHYGPGPPSKWPLGHTAGITCHLSDLVLARRVRDAYEVGFRGFKYREPPSKAWESGEVTGPRKHVMVSDALDFVTCDVCGGMVASAGAAQEAMHFFYFCRRCKQAGHRFEMCLACHATEVLQAEGKHTGRSLHPHWLRCEHHAMIRFTGVKVAYAGFPQLQRAFCDCCGKLIKVEGDRNELYVCPRCPREESGHRFELCKSCAVSLSDFGRSVQRLFKHL